MQFKRAAFKRDKNSFKRQTTAASIEDSPTAVVSAINAIDPLRGHEQEEALNTKKSFRRVEKTIDITMEHETPRTKLTVSSIECGKQYECVTPFSAESVKTESKPKLEASINSTDEISSIQVLDAAKNHEEPV